MEIEGTVLIVDDNAQSCRLAGDALEHAGCRVLLAESGEQCLHVARKHHPDVILLDRMMPGMSGDEVAAILKNDRELNGIKIIMLSAKTSTDDKIAGLNLGADDYLTKPYSRRELSARVKVHLRTKKAEDALERAYAGVERKVRERTVELSNANAHLKKEIAERKRAGEALREALGEVEQLKNRLQAENTYLRDEIEVEHNAEEILGRSQALAEVLRKVDHVAPTDATVIILGESGTGKELIARAVHNRSARRERPLVKVNCAALPASLIESELFGHEKGAFTGALARKIGRFELADGGTLFLDEIGDLPLELQAKLLRVLQDGEFERLGNPQTTKVDVRVIAATNRELQKAVEAGEFREDLYYRLNVFPLVCPPLRRRGEDIPLLAEHFVLKYGAKIGKRIATIPVGVMEALRAYHWPGNIRELENVIERAVILTRGAVLEMDEPLQGRAKPPRSREEAGTLKEIECSSISNALAECNWVIEGKSGAAARLGLPPSSLRSRMRKHGILKPNRPARS